MRRICTLLVIGFTTQFTFAQIQTISTCPGDSVYLHLNGFLTGNIQWMVSSDSVTWNNINGATDDTLGLTVDSNAYYRAEVIDGTCDPIYSDTTYVTQGGADTNMVSTTVGNWSASYQAGHEFTMVNTVTLTGFEYWYGWTAGQSGFAKIWTSTGTEILSVPFTTVDSVWTYIPAPPTVLNQGQSYVVVYALNNGNEGGGYAIFSNVVWDNTNMTYVTGKYDNGQCCGFPQDTWNNYTGNIKMIYCD